MSGERPGHINPPKQTRSRRTLERMVRASLEILEEQGSAGLTVQAIVSRASSSVGSFYARFDGKEDLLDYLEERVWREATVRWDQALAEQDWTPLGLRGVAWGAATLFAEAGTARATYLRALGRGSAGGQEGAYGSFRERVLSDIERLLLERSGEISHPDPPLAARLGLRAMLALVEAPPDDPGGQPLTAERVQAEAVGLLLAYLGGEPGDDEDEPSSARVDFFDIWG
jgi:AcrR family transcriptional regulator